jgi:Putative beta-barrel porin-2, OmpL-like. bbp2
LYRLVPARFCKSANCVALLSVCLLPNTQVCARDSTGQQPAGALSPLTISAYAEGYISHDFNNAIGNRKPEFIFNHTKTEIPAINLALVRAAWNTPSFRSSAALAAGSYMNANYAEEPGFLKHVYEANAGIRLPGRHNLWVDIGIFPSHIGFESAIGKDNWALTRSLVAEKTPYFEAGAKITYTSDDNRWLLSALVLDGWQRVVPVDGSTLPAFGTQITYKPSPGITLNSSTFAGTDTPDSSRQMRYFHNFYGIFQLHRQFAATIGFDIGIEQKQEHSTAMNIWFNPTVILRYTPTRKIAVAVRGEYYDDRHHVIITYGMPHGFRTWGVSANFDYHFTPHLLWRTEARTFISNDSIFPVQQDSTSNSNTFFTTALAVSF